MNGTCYTNFSFEALCSIYSWWHEVLIVSFDPGPTTPSC